jgi:hypothetical protein
MAETIRFQSFCFGLVVLGRWIEVWYLQSTIYVLMAETIRFQSFCLFQPREQAGGYWPSVIGPLYWSMVFAKYYIYSYGWNNTIPIVLFQPREQAGVLECVICKLLYIFLWLKRYGFDRIVLAQRRCSVVGSNLGWSFLAFSGALFSRDQNKSGRKTILPKKKWPDDTLRPPSKVTGLCFFGTPCQK